MQQNLENLYLQLIKRLKAIVTLLTARQKQNMPLQSTPAANPDTLLPWEFNVLGSENNRHNVRVLCDLGGLNTSQKNTLTACVRDESNFDTGAVHKNYVITKVTEMVDGKPVETLVRTLSTTDYGIVQINDFWHIGPGKDFSSSDYVLTHPLECIQFMVDYYKQYGHLNAWCSFTSGAYKEYLGTV